MKRIRQRILSLLMVCIMCFSLVPATALARAPDAEVMADRAFTTQPTGGNVEPGGSLTTHWDTNFTPTRIEVVSRCTGLLDGEILINVLRTLSGSAKSCELDYDELLSGLFVKDFSVYIRAYYANDDSSYIMSRDIPYTLTPRQFTTQPTGGNVEPDGTLEVSWETNYDIMWVEIVEQYTGGFDNNTYTNVLHTYFGSRTSCTLTYDDLFNRNPFIYDRTVFVRAYYSAETGCYVSSQPIPYTLTPRQFTLQPTGGHVEPDESLTVHWETNFSPVKLDVVERYTGVFGNNTYTNVLRTLEGPATSCALTYDELFNNNPFICDRTVFLRAYSEDRDSDLSRISSQPIPFTLTSREFTLQPTGGTVYPDDSLTFTWTTNFSPVKIEIVEETYNILTSNPVYIVLRTLSGSATSCTMSYDELDSGWFGQDRTIFVRAYFEDRDSDLSRISSQIVPYSRVPREFTVQPPEDVYIVEGGSVILNWQTSFMPTRLELVGQTPIFGGYSDTVIKTIVAHLTAYSISSNDVKKDDGVYARLLIRAYYNDADGNEQHIDSSPCRLEVGPAIEGTCGDDLTWSYDRAGTLTISGSGPMTDWSFLGSDSTPWYPLRDEITNVIVNSGVTTVGACAFAGLTALQEVTLPASIAVIGDTAFFYNGALTDVYFTGTEAVFQTVDVNMGNNPSLEAATIHFTARARGKCGADLYWELKNDNVLHIYVGTGAMTNWASAEDVPWHDYRADIVAVKVFAGTSIGSYAFAGCTALTSVGWGINANVTTIGAHAFDGCTALKSISIPGTVTSLGTYAFSGCTALETVTNHSTTASVPEGLFYGCSVLKFFRVPYNATAIGARAFYNCRKLESVVFPTSGKVKSIGDYAFYYCTGLTSLTLPEGITSIGAGAFSYCMYLASVNLPASLTSLGERAFYYCSALAGTLKIPAGVTAIPNNCFEICKAIVTVEIPLSVTTIGSSAFSNCIGLKNVVYPGLQTMWDQISIGNYNAPLLNAQFFFTGNFEGDLTDSISWYCNKDGTLDVYGSGAMPNYSTGSEAPWSDIAPFIKAIRVYSGVTSIGELAFRSCTQATSVSIDPCVLTIRAFAFNGCDALTDVYFDGLEETWDEIDIRPGNNPLLNATKHFSEIYDDLDPWANLEWALSGNGTLLIRHGYGSDPTGEIPDYRDDRETPWYNYQSSIRSVVIEDCVTRIGDYSMSGLSSADAITISDSVTSIGDGAFSWSGFTQVDLPDTVTELGEELFYHCTDLTTATLPSGLTAIPAYTFCGCTVLDHITIPIGVTSIGDNAFRECTALTDVYFDGTSAQWAAITVGENNEALQNVTMHFAVPELAVNEANFPDAAFRAYISENIDVDHSGYLTDYELGVTVLDCSELGITSMEGIQYFTELETLYCGYNDITALDVSRCTELLYLNCDCTLLTELDLSALTKLEDFSCVSPNLTALDVSSNTALTYLECRECGLTELDLSHNTALTMLVCQENHLTSLDLSHNTALTYIECYSNDLTELDVSMLPGLTYMDCSYNRLTSLTLGALPGLKELSCPQNDLAFLDVTDCALLADMVVNGTREDYPDDGEVEYWKGAGLFHLDDSTVIITDHDGIPVDEDRFPDAAFRAYVSDVIDANRNGYLNDAEIAAVTEIRCSEYRPASLEGIEYFPNLTLLYCYGLSEHSTTGLLTQVDLSGNPALTRVDLSFHPGLRTLDVSMLPDLQLLDVCNTGISTLDLSANGQLESLICYESDIAALDLSGNPDLTYLACYGCPRLTSLDLTPCPVLAEAYKGGGEVFDDTITVYGPVGEDDYTLEISPWTAVDVGELPITAEYFPDDGFRAYVLAHCDPSADGWLSPEEMRAVTAIDLVGLTGIASLEGIQYFPELEYLYCAGLGLTELDLSGNTKLTSMDCSENSFTALDVSMLPSLTNLSCWTNRITALDLSGNPLLAYLDCTDCQMETLILGFKPLLKHLDFQDNAITQVDLSGCTALEKLYATCNQLTELELGFHETLNRLFTDCNDLTVLDISGCPIIVDAYVKGERTVADDMVWCDNAPLGGWFSADTYTLIATGVTYPVVYDANGGVGAPAAQVKAYDVPLTLSSEIPVRTGFVFLGWAQSADADTPDYQPGDSYTANAGVILYALWRAALAIVTQPVDFTGALNETASFTVGAIGQGLIYQWQYKSLKDGKWYNTKTDGYDTPTMHIEVTAARSGMEFRCRITDAGGETVISDSAALHLAATAPIITGQPADFTGAIGETASFTVAAEGTNLTYQWQYKSLKDGKWYNTKTAGCDTPTMSIAVTAARNGMQFRCKVTGSGGSVTSEPATLHMTAPAVVITSQPEDFTGPIGETASFTVEAQGEGLTYQWQYKSLKDGKWYDTKTAGYNTPTMSIAVTNNRNGMQFRCKVTGGGTTVTSDPATLRVGTVLAITSQPEDFIGSIGDTAAFTVEAQGDDLTYQWQYKSLKDGKWYNTKVDGYDTPTMHIDVTNSRNGMQFRCKVMDAAGSTVISDPATLRVG